MAREVVNNIWVEVDGQHVKVGFTQNFLARMEECWHVLPANNKLFKKQNPMMVVETNDEMVSIPAPFDATLMHFSSKAQNFPDKLLEDDVIMELNMGATAPAARAAPQRGAQNWQDFVAPAVRPRGNAPRGNALAGGVLLDVDLAVLRPLQDEPGQF